MEQKNRRGKERKMRRFIIRMIVRFYKWKERREEERDSEMLIRKAGCW